MSVYSKFLLTISQPDIGAAAKAIRASLGDAVWGIWAGLFGIGSNELIVILVGEAEMTPAWPDGVSESSREVLRATVRPRSPTPLTREGLYVFRSFVLDAAHIDRVVELSQLAWQTFETSDLYASEPVGLFAPMAPTAETTMYLLTWYDGLGSWETSRSPDPQARQYFRERHALMRATKAIATRLIR